MSTFMQEPLAEASRRAPHWLQALRSRGQAQWNSDSLPTRRSEQWKYTSLGALRDDYRFADPQSAHLQALPAATDVEFGGPRLVFVDGLFQPQLSSSEMPEGVSLCRFEDADDTQSARIAEYLDTAIVGEASAFTALNTATVCDGVFVEIAANAQVEQPLHILWIGQQLDTATAISQRMLCLAGRGSRSSVIEQFLSVDAEQYSFCNGLTELLLEDNAELTHYRLQQESGAAIHIGAVHAKLARDARLHAFHLGLGSVLKRLDLVVTHAGPGAHVDLNGVYLPRGEEHIDYHTTIEHAVPHCTSDEIFRGIIADRASAVFNGRIHIHPQAQKTRAEMSNRNLLTSAEAEVNTKPELEIYADDVQCAHGATVAQLDELSLHYLSTRGVPRDEAEVMLSFGFINELIDGLELESMRSYLRPVLAARFARDSELARHLL